MMLYTAFQPAFGVGGAMLLFLVGIAQARNTTVHEINPPFRHDGTPRTICPQPCGPYQFCGRDSACHNYTCENWYLHAESAYTTLGHDDSGSDPTRAWKCRTLSLVVDPPEHHHQADTSFLSSTPWCETGLPLAVVWTNNVSARELRGAAGLSAFCDDGNPETFPKVAALRRATLAYDEKCTAQSTDGTEGFVCYQVSSEAVENFALQVQKIVDSDDILSKNDTAVESDDASRFLYENHLNGWTYATIAGTNETNRVSFNYRHGMRDESPSANFIPDRARAVMRTFRFDVRRQTMPFCPDGCPANSFCGRDNSCHKVGDCQAFYEYASDTMTGLWPEYQNEAKPLLTCTDYYQEDVSYPSICGPNKAMLSAIQYQCHRYNVWTINSIPCPTSNYTDGRELSFHRMCTAQPNPYQKFVCFDTQGIPASAVQEFEAKIRANPICRATNVQSWNRGDNDDKVTCHLQTSANHRDCLRADFAYTDRMRNASYSTTVSQFGPQRDAEDVALWSGDAVPYKVNPDWLNATHFSLLMGRHPEYPEKEAVEEDDTTSMPVSGTAPPLGKISSNMLSILLLGHLGWLLCKS